MARYRMFKESWDGFCRCRRGESRDEKLGVVKSSGAAPTDEAPELRIMNSPLSNMLVQSTQMKKAVKLEVEVW